MKRIHVFGTLLVSLAVIMFLPSLPAAAEENAPIDDQVRRFLEKHKNNWNDYNVPAVDGRTLHDLIIKNGHTRALEIGTSTGHSAIWIAWALSKTGGRLITIEVDEGRYREALANFAEAGVAAFIDARLGDAHELVPQLEGPFDFVFSDADKEWYSNYLKAVLPKLEVNGCFTAHNVSSRMRGIGEFLEYVNGLPNMETTIDTQSSSGISISCKKY